MKKTILKIGAEGGSLEFYKTVIDGATVYSSQLSPDFKSARELFEAYTRAHDPLLWYYPVEISEEIRSELLLVLTREYRENDPGHFRNLAEWEHKLNLKFSEILPAGQQKFRIRPLSKYAKYSYDSIGPNPQFLDSVTTNQDVTGKSRELSGIGSVEGNAFVIRDENGLMKGVFPFDQYEIECN